MKKDQKFLRIVGIIVGILALLVILIWPAAPLWAKLGVEPVCIQGTFPRIKFSSCSEEAKLSSQVTPIPLPTQIGNAPIPLIFDDDGSPDGVIALMYFLRNPNFDVQAVTVSCGEAHPEMFAQHMAQLLAGLGYGEIPVGVGSSLPLEGTNTFPEPWREGSDNFWGIQIPSGGSPAEPVPAAQLIVDTLMNSSQPVLVFVSGNHTNLAEALRLEPGIVEHIRTVQVMGGAVHVEGNIESDWPEIHNQAAEWNIWVDPVAAREVFQSGAPIRLAPLDATDQVVWDKKDAQGWASSGTKEGKLAADLLVMMLDAFSVKNAYIWDLVAAVNAPDQALCKEEMLALDVLTVPGEEQGRTVIVGQEPNTAVCLEPDITQIKLRAALVLGLDK